jgi:hypothetical protein
MAEDEGVEGFVERMFPEPRDHGIAEEDRAVSNVGSGPRRRLIGRETCGGTRGAAGSGSGRVVAS